MCVACNIDRPIRGDAIIVVASHLLKQRTVVAAAHLTQNVKHRRIQVNLVDNGILLDSYIHWSCIRYDATSDTGAINNSVLYLARTSESCQCGATANTHARAVAQRLVWVSKRVRRDLLCSLLMLESQFTRVCIVRRGMQLITQYISQCAMSCCRCCRE